MTYEELLDHIDQPVMVVPRTQPYQSVDTEEGLQPWKAILVGRDSNMAIIDQGENYGLRRISPDVLRIAK